MNKKRLLDKSKKPVSVALKKQPLLPLCLSVVEEYQQISKGKIRLNYPVTLNNRKAQLWLDAEFFKEALRGLIDEAISHSRNGDSVNLSISGGMNFTLIRISFTPPKSTDVEFDEEWDHRRVGNSRVWEIISQHRAKVTQQTVNKRVTIDISFEK